MIAFLTSSTNLICILSAIFAIGGFWVLSRCSHEASTSRDSSGDDGRYLSASIVVIIFLCLMALILHNGLLWSWKIFGSDTRYEELIYGARAGPEKKSAALEIHNLLDQIEPLLSEADADSLCMVHGRKSLGVFADLVRDDFNSARSILEDHSFRQRVQKYISFLSPSADTARVVYETRSIIGYAAAITVTCVVFFVPILLGLWLNAIRRIEERLIRLIGCRSITTVDQGVLNQHIDIERSFIQKLEEMGRAYRGSFYIIVLFMMILLFGLSLINFSQPTPIHLYVWAVWFLTASIMRPLNFYRICHSGENRNPESY